VFREGSRTDQDQAERLSAALSAFGGQRIKHYFGIFKIGANTPRKRLISPDLAVRYPELAKRLRAEQDRLFQLIGSKLFGRPESLEPPDDPLPPPSPAARFTYTDGRFDVAPTGAWRDREAQANVYHARAKALATELAKRLSRTDAVPDVAGSVTALLDVLGTRCGCPA
jgi:hypothetical protein